MTRPGRSARRNLAQSSRRYIHKRGREIHSGAHLHHRIARHGIMVRQRTMSAMKRSVEAGDLGQSRAVDEKRADGRQVVRLVQWRERDVSLQTAQHFLVDKNGAAVVWAAMDNAMAHRDEIDAKFIAQPGAAACKAAGTSGTVSFEYARSTKVLPRRQPHATRARCRCLQLCL